MSDVIAAKIAWSYNRWKGFDRKGFENKEKYGFEFVKSTGIPGEWWNFYEDFNEDFYFGDVQTKGKIQKFKRGLVIFISRNVEDNNFYFVGFYGYAEYSKFKIGKTLPEILPEDVQLQLREDLENGKIPDKFAGWLKKHLVEKVELSKNLRAKKDYSTVFLDECYVPISANDLEIKKFGQGNIIYIDKKEKILPFLKKARDKHEEILKDENISENKKEEARLIIKKIDYVVHVVDDFPTNLNMYFNSKGYHYPSYLISQFYTALKTKGFVILSGLTGTGKTKIALEFVDFLKNIPLTEIPQLMSASGRYTKAEEEIEALQNMINKYGFVTYGWNRVGKAGKINPPFIFWLYDSNPDDKFYQQIPYGLLVQEVKEKDNLPEDWNRGVEWIEKAYKEKNVKDYLNEHKIFFKVSKVIKCGEGVSKFKDANKNQELKPTEVGPKMRQGFILVKAPQEYIHIDNLHIFFPVRPDWRDSKPLLGYYNPIDDRYYTTSLLDLILKAKKDYEENKKNAMPYFIILDEMNLAHVEYYFSDFLSVLESGRDDDGFTRESIKLHDVDDVEEKQGIPKEIRLPPNLYIIGTVNMDETTYSFSPKVLDRAFTIEFREVNIENYPPKVNELSEDDYIELRNKIIDDLRREGKFLVYSKEEDVEDALNKLKEKTYWNILKSLNSALEAYDMHFGYRIIDEIALFIQNANKSKDKDIVTFENEDEIFDLAILMKILPKFHGNRKKLEKPLLILLKMAKDGKLDENYAKKDTQELWNYLFGEKSSTNRVENIVSELNNINNYTYKHTARKVLRMLRELYEIGFASFS